VLALETILEAVVVSLPAALFNELIDVFNVFHADVLEVRAVVFLDAAAAACF
jgi:hypothetical protein